MSNKTGVPPLRAVRLARGLSMAELGKSGNTSAQQIERLEKGDRKFTKQWAERLAPALGVDAQFLLFATPEQIERLTRRSVSAPNGSAADQPVNVALDEALLKQALAVAIEEAAQLPQGEASLPLMAEVLATSVVRSLKRAQAQHSAGSGSSPETGMLSSHIRSAFRGLFPADH